MLTADITSQAKIATLAPKTLFHFPWKTIVFLDSQTPNLLDI